MIWHILEDQLIKVGDKKKVEKGQALTDGSLNIEQLYELAGRRSAAEEYVINELNKSI